MHAIGKRAPEIGALVSSFLQVLRGCYAKSLQVSSSAVVCSVVLG